MATIDEIAASIGLAADDLAGLSELDPDALAALAAQIETTLTDEDQRVTTSLEAALNAVPRPLRRRARAMLTEGK